MGWNAISSVSIRSALDIRGNLTNNFWRLTDQSDYLRLYNANGTEYFNFAAQILYANTSLQVNTTANIGSTLTIGSSLNINNASSIFFNKTATSAWIIEFGTSPNGFADSMIFFHRETSPATKGSRWWFNGFQANTSSEISDERIKKEINDIQNPLNKINDIKTERILFMR